jgi:hypothetical protein
VNHVFSVNQQVTVNHHRNEIQKQIVNQSEIVIHYKNVNQPSDVTQKVFVNQILTVTHNKSVNIKNV